MSLIILDEQLAADEVLAPLQRVLKAQPLPLLRPGEQVLDDRVPEILLGLPSPTFVTIDQGFWHRRWCHPGYCILYFALRKDQQERLPGLLRAILRVPQFRTRASRLGKVVRVGASHIDYWQYQVNELGRIPWPRPRRRRR